MTGTMIRNLLNRNLAKCLNCVSAHGFQYLVMPGFGILGRLIWLMAIIIGFSLTAIYFHTSVAEWEDDKTITTIKNPYKPVDLIQFPSLTVCLGMILAC